MSAPRGKRRAESIDRNSASAAPIRQSESDQHLSLRTRIAVPFVLLLAIAMLVLGLILSQLARDVYAERLTTQLENEAQLISEVIGPLDRVALQPEVARLGNATDSRITVIRADGVVLADSEQDPATMENHGRRPEVVQALGGAAGSDQRRSVTVGENLLYAAVPLGTPPEMVVRVAVPLAAIDAIIRDVQRGLLLLTMSIGAVAIVIAIRLADRISGPLNALQRQAHAIASGRFDSRVFPSGPRELREVGEAFNSMAATIRRESTARERTTRRLEAVLASLADGVVITDQSGSVIRMNQAAASMLRVDAEESIRQPFVVVSRDYELASLLRRALNDGVASTATVEVGLGRRLLESSALPVTGGSEELGLMVLRDVTEIRHLEAVRREFVANVSHELRTPLAAIKALVETLEGGAIDDPDVAPVFLSRIVGEVDRLADLVADLLDLARLESGRIEVRIADAKPLMLVSSGVQRLLPLIERAQLDLSVNVPEDLPIVGADRSRIEQVLLNLVHNAVKFTPPGGHLEISAARDQTFVRFAIRDTGAGIPDDELPRLFERFYKADRARRTEGTGLGLAIAKHIVQVHGGSIWAESTVGQGSTFFFTLPIAASE